MKINKPTKGFCLWLIIGLALYAVFAAVYICLSDFNTLTVSNSALMASADQIKFENNICTTTGTDPKFFFSSGDNFSADYIDIAISEISSDKLEVQLFYSNTEKEFNESNSVKFNLYSGGVNEINIKPYKYYRLDPSKEENISFKIDKVILRSSKNPVYVIHQSFIIFIISWLLVYFAAAFFGIKYTEPKKGLILLSEALFVFFLSMTLVYYLNYVSFKSSFCILMPLCVFSLSYLYAKINSFKQSSKLIVGFSLAVMTFFLLFIGLKTISNPLSDLGQVYTSAWEIVRDGKLSTEITGNEVISPFFKTSNNDYFVQYHTNIPILALFTLFYKFLSLFGLTQESIMSNYLSVVLNAGFIMSAVIFGMLSAKNLFGEKGMVIYVIMSVFFVPFYVHVNRYYTDTFSLPFTALAIWLYTCPEEKFKYPCIKYILTALSIGIGFLIKGSLIIITVAIAIHSILKSIKSLKYVLIVFAVVIGVNSVWSLYINNCRWIDMSENETIEFPLTHWIMMGLNTSTKGEYSQSDMEFTMSFETKEQKQRENINKIKRRLGEFNSIGEFADYEFSKSALTWGDGQYMQDGHITLGINKGRLYRWILSQREYYPLYRIYIQLYNYCMLIFAVIGGIFALKKPKPDFGMFLRLTMLGIIFFFMMWESKSRYLLNFVPVFMLASIYGLEEIKSFFNKAKAASDITSEQ